MSIAELSNMLLDQGDNFSKKPLRKSHLREAYFTQLFGLTNTIGSTKMTDVFELYLQRRTPTMIDPLIHIFGK